jgi:hypothetical protein
MRVTEHYSISGQVPFVNVRVDRDNLLFLDPSAIRNDTDPISQRAQHLLITFFTEVLRCRRSSSAPDRRKGLALLQHLHEPNETRLGMSRSGVAGHGFGDELGEDLWNKLGTNAACRSAALTRIEDLALFVDGVGKDLISDMTTRVVYELLADYTTHMVSRFPSLAVGQTSRDVDVWDPSMLVWTQMKATLPYITPHQLLLVPKRWVFWRMLMDPTAFYNRHATRTVQDERASYDSEGRRLAPTKRVIKKEFREIKALNNRQASRYKTDNVDLVAQYRQQVDDEYEPLDDNKIMRRTEG